MNKEELEQSITSRINELQQEIPEPEKTLFSRYTIDWKNKKIYLHKEEPLAVGGFGKIYIAYRFSFTTEPLSFIPDMQNTTFSKWVLKTPIKAAPFLGETIKTREYYGKDVYTINDEGILKAIVMPYFGGSDLSTFLDDHPNLTPQEKSQLTRDIALSFNSMHHVTTNKHSAIAHLDIKPENIIIDYDKAKRIFSVYPIDFGLSNYATDENQIDNLKEERGTPGYIAPEIRNRANKTFGIKSDIYSLGVTFGQIYNMFKITNAVMQEIQILHPHNSDHVEHIIRAFILKMLDPNPEVRPDSDQVLKFFTDATNYYLLQENIENAPSDADLKARRKSCYIKLLFSSVGANLNDPVHLKMHHTISEYFEQYKKLKALVSYVSGNTFLALTEMPDASIQKIESFITKYLDLEQRHTYRGKDISFNQLKQNTFKATIITELADYLDRLLAQEGKQEEDRKSSMVNGKIKQHRKIATLFFHKRPKELEKLDTLLKAYSPDTSSQNTREQIITQLLVCITSTSIEYERKEEIFLCLHYIFKDSEKENTNNLEELNMIRTAIESIKDKYQQIDFASYAYIKFAHLKNPKLVPDDIATQWLFTENQKTSSMNSFRARQP